MAKPKKSLDDIIKKYGVTSNTTTNKNNSGKQSTSASSKKSTTSTNNTTKANNASTKNNGGKTLDDIINKYMSPSSKTKTTTKKYTDYSTETKNAYNSVKDRMNSKTTIKSDLSDAERKARLKEIDTELNALGTKIHGYSRAKAYGTSKAMLESEQKDKARLAELQEEKKKLERVGTFTGTELKQFEIEDAKKNLSSARQKVNSYGARPTTATAESYRQAVSEQYKAEEELNELKRQKKLYDNITKYGDDVHKDNNEFGQFEMPKTIENIVDLITKDDSKEEKEISEYLKDFDSQWRANYRSNKLSREADKASNRNYENSTAENKELAYAYDYLEKRYRDNNEKALDDENVRASWLTKDLAGYLPQGIDQALPELAGGAVGGIVGAYFGAPDKGWAVGSGIASSIQSYGVIRGSVYRELLSQGVDDETARELAADDALIESLIEGGETALGWLFAGGGKAKTAIYNAAKSSVAKGSTKAVTNFVANMATKASDKALTKAAKAVSRPLWNTAVRTGIGVGLQGLTEGLEEGFQGSISRATREKAWASIDNELGQYGAGNIDLHSRPIYKNEDGTISTVDSVTYEVDGKYVVLPTIVRDEYGKAKRLSEDEIFEHYIKTGEYLGIFDSLETANGYANALHYAQAYRYSDSTSTEADDNVIVGGAKVLKDAIFGGNEEAFGELAEQFGGGFRVGVMLGGSHVAVNNVITHYANAKTVKNKNEIADAYIKDEKSLKELIASGKESGEGTVSEKIATEIETAMKNGKAVTREQVKRLIESTDVYKQAEETTLESAAREVVESREASLDMLKDRQNGKVDAGMLETLTQKNVPITSEEVKKVTRLGDRGAELVAKIANEEGNTFTQAVDEVEATYLTGFNHPEMDIKDVAHTFTADSHKDAYTAGQIDAVKQNTEAAIKAQNYRVFGAESGVDYKNSQNIEQYTPDQIKMADTAGKDHGSKYSFEERLLANEETEYEANAWHQDGEIKRSNTSNEKFIADIMEESLHRMAQVNTEEVQVLLREAYDLVAEKERNLGAEGHNFNEQKALYDSAGQPINTRGVMEEVSVGVLSTELFRNEKAWNKWRERLDTNPELRSAWQKLCDFVSEIIEKLRRLLAEKSFSKATREKVNKDIADMKRMLDLYGKAYVATRDAVAEKTKAVESAETTTESKNEGVTSENATSDKESHTETKSEEKPKQTPNTSKKINDKTKNILGKDVSKRVVGVKGGRAYISNGKITIAIKNTDVAFVKSEWGLKDSKEVANSVEEVLNNEYVPISTNPIEGKMSTLSLTVFTTDDGRQIAIQTMYAKYLDGYNLSAAFVKGRPYAIKATDANGNLEAVVMAAQPMGRKTYELTDTKVVSMKSFENKPVASENKSANKETTQNTKTKQEAKTEGIKRGDVFVAKKSGIKYKILSRDDKNTIVEITSSEGTERTIISNEIADRNFSNMSDEGITKWIDEDSHIDNRTWEDVGDRKVKAFQYLFPEMKEYYMPLANELLSDLSNTIKGEKILTGNYVDGYEWAGQSRLTSEAIANIKDSTNASYDDIRDALERLIADKGQENIALAKRIELVFDDMLTNGYKTFEGEKIPANEEYITKKEALLGKTYEGKNADADLDWMFDTKFSLKGGKTANEEGTSIKEQIKQNQGKLNNMNVIASINTSKKFKNAKEALEWAVNQLKSSGYKTERQGFGTVIFDEKRLRNGLQYIKSAKEYTAFALIPKVIKRGKTIGEHSNHKDRGYGTVTFAAPIEIDGVRENMAVVVRMEGKNYYKLHRVIMSDSIVSNKKRNNAETAAATTSVVVTPTDIVSNETISQNPKSVNRQFSLKDSKGKTLTKEQQDYFKDSKVRDDNGNLLVVYHGTRKADFTVFKRNINFFTDNKEMAESYSPSGEMYEGYLNITNPYVIDAKGEKWSKVPIDETTKQFLQEYGASVFKEVGKWRTTPADIASAIEEAVDNGDLDYDGVIIKNIDDTGSYYKGKEKNLGTDYISFNSNQFKNSDNTNPTSNPDIRFSLKKPVEETKNLVAVHNVWEHKLREAFELGGLPSPSIAITKKDFSHDNFGDISLVFRKDTISPTDRRNKVYGGDAYTPARQQIDYKISDKALDKLEGRISKLVDRDIRSAFHLSFDSSNVENDLQRENGNFVEAYKRNEALKIAFLKDKGIPFKTVMKTKEISQFADNVVLRRITRAIGKDTLDKARQDSKLAFTQEPLIRKLLNDRMEEQGAPRIYDEPLTAYQVDNILMGARDYIWLGEQKTVDYYATRDRLEKKFTKKLTTEYESWLAELGEGIVEKKGIRNDRDLFTPSGNRRSFEALHWDYTLENIVKSMNSQQSKGSAFWGGNVFGASTKEYESIADIKADSSRLQEMSDEEYEAIKAEYKDRLDDIAQAYANGKSYYDAEDTLIEAISIKKTKQGIRSYLAQCDYVYKVTDDIVNDLWELRNDISQMPVSYFEAKPQRAVGFNEVVAAVIPRAKDKSLKTELENRGVKVLEYNKSKDGDRLKKINSVPDVNFSLKGGLSPMEYLNTLEAAQKGKKGAAEKLAKYVDSGMIRTKTYDELIEKYGVIPTGERPHRDIQVPRKSGKNKKVSQTVRTILEAQATPDEAVPTIQKMVEDGVFSYDVYTDKQAITDAESYIKEYGWDESLDDWFDAVNSGEVSKELTTMGWALYNNAANKAATTTSETERTTAIKTSLKILDAMVRHQRSAAQALQATRILKKLSPETQLYGVQKSVQALQNELSEKYGDKAPDLKINEELAEQFINAKTPEERAEVEKEIYKDIGRQMPARFVDKWNAWRYLAMLGNPRTHIRNLLGNAFFAPVVGVKNLTATAIESAVYRVSGKKMLRGKAIIKGNKSDRALLKAAWSDYKNVADLISNGGKYNDSAIASQQIEDGRRIFKFKPLEWARKTNSKLLEGEDVLFSKPHYAYALAQYCKANNITAEQIGKGVAIAPAREYAIKEAQKATYRDTNAFSQMVSEWGRKKNEKNVVKKAFNTVIEGILPFRKTPANILVRGVEYSPLGLLKGLSYDLVQVGKGKMSATEAIDNISAGLTGTGLLALGVYLAAQGLVRGHGEDEEEERKFNEMMGHQAYSLELPNGESITLDWLAPEALPFFVGVNIWESTIGSKEDINLSNILQSVSHITEPMLEMSCLQGLNDLFEGIGYASSNDTSGLVSVVSSAVTSYIMQGIPTLSGQAERTSEENRMTTYTEKNSFLTGDMQYTLGKVSAKIPGWDYSQIPYIDAWGRKEASGVALKRGLNNFLNPAYTSTIETSRMEEELLWLYEQTGEASVFPTRADKYFMVDGDRKDLTAEEYVRYATLKGEKSRKAVEELVNSSAYQKLTDAEKVKAVEDAYDYANQKAKAAISNYKPQKWVSTADKFSSVGNYLSFKTEYNNTKEEKGEGFSTQDEIDIILDMAQTDSEIWQMYLSNHKANKDVIAYNMGIEGGKYMTVLQNMDKYDEPNENGNLGTYTNDEISIAIDMTGGLTNSQKAELWQAMTGSTSTKNNPWRRYLP